MIKHQLPLEPVGENAVTLVCCGNAAFAAPTAVLFRSVMDHAAAHREFSKGSAPYPGLH